MRDGLTSADSGWGVRSPEQRAKRRAYAVALAVALPGLSIILVALWQARLYLNAALHALVLLLTLAGLLTLWRWPRLMPLGERLMGGALTLSGVGFAVARLWVTGALLFPGFSSLVLLFIGLGLLLALPTRLAGWLIAGLFGLTVVGDWWPAPSAPALTLLAKEGALAGGLALAMILALYRHWLSAAQRERQAYEQLAHTDHLTELPNRRAVLAAWRTLSTARDSALLIIDLDDFKRINDRYGHHEGDRVLWHVGQVLMDALGGRGTLGRWGGEEFLAVLPLGDLPQAAAVAEELRAAVQAGGGGPAPLSISVGLTLCRLGEPFGPALRRADAAMYRAKRDGKNRVSVEVAEELVR